MTATDSRAGRSGAKDVLLAGVVVVVVALAVVVGIGALFADEAEVVPLVADVEQGEVPRDAFEAVPLAADEAAVERALLPARPLDAAVVERYEVSVPEVAAESCLYYEAEGGLPRDLYRFCFVGDQLVDKEYVA